MLCNVSRPMNIYASMTYLLFSLPTAKISKEQTAGVIKIVQVRNHGKKASWNILLLFSVYGGLPNTSSVACRRLSKFDNRDLELFCV